MSHRDHPSTPRTARRILALSIGGLGDTILFSPVLKALRSRYPNAHIELLLSSQLARKAFAPVKEIDRIITANTYYSFLPAKAAVVLSYSFKSRLSGGFDIGVFATGLNPKLVSFLRIIGGIRRVYCAPKPPFHETDLGCNLILARRFDDNICEQDVIFPITKEALEEAQKELTRQNIQDTSQILAVYPSHDFRHRPRWPIQKLVEVIKLLKKSSFKGKVVVIGSPEEGKQWESTDSSNIVDANLAGKLTISAVGALLSRCCLALGNDGGIMHVAGAVGCPLVDVMTNVPVSYRPPGLKTVVVKSSVQSPPWSQRYHLQPSEVARLTEAITVEEVFHACRELLEGGG